MKNISFRLSQEGQKHAREGDHESAIICYNQALVIDPRNPRIWDLKTAALQALGRDDEAKETAKMAKDALSEKAQALAQAQAKAKAQARDPTTGWDWTPSRIIITILLTIGQPLLFVIIYLVSGTLFRFGQIILASPLLVGFILLLTYYLSRRKYFRKIEMAKRPEYRWRTFITCAGCITTLFSLFLIIGLINWFLIFNY